VGFNVEDRVQEFDDDKAYFTVQWDGEKLRRRTWINSIR
jgi:hypothetical protein